jgi:hypothetical protein
MELREMPAKTTRTLSRGLSVTVAQSEVRRGCDLEAWLTVESADGLSALEVGLICTEFYAAQAGGSPPGFVGGTSSGLALETWQPVECVAGRQAVRLTIPRDAPFSYEGEVLAYRWQVALRSRRGTGRGAQARHHIVVLP